MASQSTFLKLIAWACFSAMIVGAPFTTGCSCSNTPPGIAVDSGSLDGSGDAFMFPDLTHTSDAMLSAEVCDGVDNDGNGIADDIDVGGDGICDCLFIATLGIAGEWGEGDVFASWLDARSDRGATDLADAVLTDELLAPYQVIVVQDVRGRAYSTDEIAALTRWIEGGGGLMTLIGYGDPDERTNVNALLMPTGLQYDSEQILLGTPITIPVTTWHTHPVSDMVTQIGIDNGYEVIGDGTVVAEQSGFVVLRATTLGAGRVLVWADEWITYNTLWVDHPEYQLERFWLNAIKWLTPSAECQVPILL